jgi:hypothetical protein
VTADTDIDVEHVQHLIDTTTDRTLAKHTQQLLDQMQDQADNTTDEEAAHGG